MYHPELLSFTVQVRTLCEKAKEILMDESNVQVCCLHALFLFSTACLFFLLILCQIAYSCCLVGSGVKVILVRVGYFCCTCF